MYNIPDHQYTAEGILPDLGPHQLELQVDIRGFLIFHPLMQVASSKDDIVEQPVNFGEFGLETRLSQVLSAGLDDICLMVFYATEAVN